LKDRLEEIDINQKDLTNRNPDGTIKGHGRTIADSWFGELDQRRRELKEV